MRALIPFCLGAPQGCFYQEFAAGITEALQELGHEPSYFPFEEAGRATREGESLGRQLDRTRPELLLDLACWGFALSHVRAPSIFDGYGTRYVGMLFDHPFHQALSSIQSRQLYAAYPDMGHSRQVKLLFPDLRLSGEVLAPPAIRPVSDRSKPFPLREIDVLYVGNLRLGATRRSWHDPGGGLDAQFCDAVVEEVFAAPERSLHLSVEKVLRLHGRREKFDLQTHMSRIERFFRYIFRRDAVDALAQAGVRMRIVGQGWQQLELPANVDLQDPIDYADLYRLAGTARICLDASTYLDGANDRVFTYGLNGALCFTNAAGYLRTVMGEEDGMRYYSLGNLAALVDEVRGWLARPHALREAGERAHALVVREHTWRRRLEHILAAMRLTNT